MISKSKLLVAATFGVASVIVVPTAVDAGTTVTWPLQTDLSTYAWGALGDVRNSASSNEYIGCTFYANVNAALTEVQCTARDANNQIFWCHSTDAAIRSVATSMTANSFVFFNGSNGGACTYLQVDNYSYLRPTTP